ncbi:calcium/proton exchanger [Obba rivulosa]|uniref:Calcium/proton exchanger n=1 Tax=Obba rivulosa TaxID=1052685 RepID=A0A8E2DTD2_9APHY|nr:calcium/proton exchanger [Obba rivulosa]
MSTGSSSHVDHDMHFAETQTAALAQRRTMTAPQEGETGLASDARPRNNSYPPLSSNRRTSQAPPNRRNSRIPNLAEISRVMSDHVKPEKKLRPAPGLREGIKAIITGSWLNVLLVFIPISWALNFALPKTNSNDTLIFIFSFLSIIPLAKLLAFATDELSLRVGQTLAGLLNATLGNAVELIVAIIALVKCELQVVQSSLVGSILSNLLLVLGMCFFAGGTRFSEQGFGMSATQLNSSLLTVSVIAVLLPAAFHFVGGDSNEAHDILSVSHGVAIILLWIYGSYLVFQLFSHKEMYADRSNDVQPSVKYQYAPGEKPFIRNYFAKNQTTSPNGSQVPLTPREDASTSHDVHPDPETGLAPPPKEEEEEEETPQMSVPLTIGLLAVVTVIVAVTAEWLVDSINGLTATGVIRKEFVGLILLPIVGNAAEHVTAVTVSVKDKLTLSLGVAVGSSIQIALFVIPFIVTLGWIIGKPLTLLFDPFESIVLFLAVLVVNYCVQDGKSNWLEGMILMCLYVILAVTFWYYPGDNIALQQCS